jgi:hypothetical protein
MREKVFVYVGGTGVGGIGVGGTGVGGTGVGGTGVGGIGYKLHFDKPQKLLSFYSLSHFFIPLVVLVLEVLALAVLALVDYFRQQ